MMIMELLINEKEVDLLRRLILKYKQLGEDNKILLDKGKGFMVDEQGDIMVDMEIDRGNIFLLLFLKEVVISRFVYWKNELSKFVIYIWDWEEEFIVIFDLFLVDIFFKEKFQKLWELWRNIVVGRIMGIYVKLVFLNERVCRMWKFKGKLGVIFLYLNF